MRRPAWLVLALCGGAACGGGEVDAARSVVAERPAVVEGPAVAVAPAADPDTVRLTFSVDPANTAGSEEYVCLVIDAPPLAGRYVRSVDWAPPGGAVSLHHAALWGVRGEYAIGPVSCDDPPEGTVLLHMYTPGAVPLALPEGVALAIPDDTTRLVISAHALRTADGHAEPTTVKLSLTEAPAHVARWVDDRAPVPTIPPHAELASTGRCTFGAPVHVVSTWPHMHLAGKSFYGAILRSNGARESLVDIDRWDFHHQIMYPRDVTLEAGDAIETLCVWADTGDEPVYPGPFSVNEMCNQGLYVWPAEDAFCVPLARLLGTPG